MAAQEIAVVSGYALKVLREGVGLTQVQIAERFEVDLSTVQAWESGRRPLGALQARQLLGMRARLTRLGCPLPAAMQLSEAVEADAVITAAVRAGSQSTATGLHPLAAAVHRRSLVNLITWPFTGITPAALRALPIGRRRGPVADRPTLSRVERSRFFDHMQATATAATAAEHSMLRRQATYLLGFDDRADSQAWLVDAYRRAVCLPVGDRDLPAGIELRSAALALARRGDPEPVRRLIDGPLSEEGHAAAQLNYWAYWLGETTELHSRDEDMLTVAGNGWGGVRLMGHLISRLDDPGHADLNIHSLWTLVLARRTLLGEHPAVQAALSARIEHVDMDPLSVRSRTELTKLRAAAEMAER